MKDQHEKIKGYRDLQQEEIDFINQIKQKAEEVDGLIKELHSFRELQRARFWELEKAENSHLEVGEVVIDDRKIDGLSGDQLIESAKCRDRATTSLKTGFMWLVRSVALPEGF